MFKSIVHGWRKQKAEISPEIISSEIWRFDESPRALKTTCCQLLKKAGVSEGIIYNQKLNDETNQRSTVIVANHLTKSKLQTVHNVLQDIADRNKIPFVKLNRQPSPTELYDISNVPERRRSMLSNQSSYSIEAETSTSLAEYVNAPERLIVVKKSGLIFHQPIMMKVNFTPRDSKWFEMDVLDAFGSDIKKDCVVGFGFRWKGRKMFIRSDFYNLSKQPITELIVYFSGDLRAFDQWVDKCIDGMGDDDSAIRASQSYSSFGPLLADSRSDSSAEYEKLVTLLSEMLSAQKKEKVNLLVSELQAVNLLASELQTLKLLKFALTTMIAVTVISLIMIVTVINI